MREGNRILVLSGEKEGFAQLLFDCVSRVALRGLLVFNVASQKNAISDGFCPFLCNCQARILAPGRRQRNVAAGLA